MKHRTIILILSTALATLTLGFVPNVPPALLGLKYTIEKESTLSIRGTTNINSFECFSRQSFAEQSVRLEFDGSSKKVIFKDAGLKLRVEELDCDNSKMNEDLCEALNSDEFPNIVITLHEAYLGSGGLSAGWNEIIVKSSLSVAGVTHKINIKAKAQQLDENRFRFVAEHWIRMTDYGVDPPTALLGLIKVRDDIAINLNVIARVTSQGSLSVR